MKNRNLFLGMFVGLITVLLMSSHSLVDGVPYIEENQGFVVVLDAGHGDGHIMIREEKSCLMKEAAISSNHIVLIL